MCHFQQNSSDNSLISSSDIAKAAKHNSVNIAKVTFGMPILQNIPDTTMTASFRLLARKKIHDKQTSANVTAQWLSFLQPE